MMVQTSRDVEGHVQRHATDRQEITAKARLHASNVRLAAPCMWRRRHQEAMTAPCDHQGHGHTLSSYTYTHTGGGGGVTGEQHQHQHQQPLRPMVKNNTHVYSNTNSTYIDMSDFSANMSKQEQHVRILQVV